MKIYYNNHSHTSENVARNAKLRLTGIKGQSFICKRDIHKKGQQLHT